MAANELVLNLWDTFNQIIGFIQCMSFTSAWKDNKMSNILTNLLKEKFAKHRSN